MSWHATTCIGDELVHVTQLEGRLRESMPMPMPMPMPLDMVMEPGWRWRQPRLGLEKWNAEKPRTRDRISVCEEFPWS